MQKLKNSVLDRMIQAHLTKAEVDFILELSHYQDETGKIYGVYYKDICEAIGISYQTFYVTIQALAGKGLIRLDKSYYGDWDVVIVSNDFSYPEAVKEGYISTGHDIFYNKHFRGLKANEKLLAMQFLKIAGAGKRYHIRVDLLYSKYSELLSVSKRTIQVYLGRLKAFFSIGIKDKMYWITPLIAVFKEQAPTDVRQLSRHLGDVACRRNKATYTGNEFQDTISLIKQYGQQLKTSTATIFLQAVKSSILKTNESIRNKRKWNRQLNPKFIHKIIIESM